MVTIQLQSFSAKCTEVLAQQGRVVEAITFTYCEDERTRLPLFKLTIELGSFYDIVVTR